MQFAVLLFAATAAVFNPNPWERKGVEDGVVIWTRAVPGAEIVEVRGVKEIAAPPERVWEALNDYRSYRTFMPYMVGVRRLKEWSGGHLQHVLSEPPVITKRDYVQKTRYSIDPQTGIYQQEFRAVDAPDVPVPPGFVRVGQLYGSWTLEPLPKGGTRATYAYFCDPGGWVPAVAVNLGAAQTVPPIINAVAHRAIDPSWNPANVDGELPGAPVGSGPASAQTR